MNWFNITLYCLETKSRNGSLRSTVYLDTSRFPLVFAFVGGPLLPALFQLFKILQFSALISPIPVHLYASNDALVSITYVPL
jgi:hypothetical protein